MASTSRPRSRRWRLLLSRRRGPRSPGARAQPIGSPRALHACGCEPLIATTGWANRARRNGSQEWLLIEWPEGEKEPTKYWLSTLPDDIDFERLIELAKLRWRIERDYQDLKQELGLGHYEGRSWRGFHHHASLCIAAYGFLVAERARISPSASAAAKLAPITLPAGDRPRGASDPTGAACAELNCHHAQETHRGPGPKSRAMPVLRNPEPQPSSSHPFVTQ